MFKKIVIFIFFFSSSYSSTNCYLSGNNFYFTVREDEISKKNYSYLKKVMNVYNINGRYNLSYDNFQLKMKVSYTNNIRLSLDTYLILPYSRSDDLNDCFIIYAYSLIKTIKYFDENYCIYFAPPNVDRLIIFFTDSYFLEYTKLEGNPIGYHILYGENSYIFIADSMRGLKSKLNTMIHELCHHFLTNDDEKYIESMTSLIYKTMDYSFVKEMYKGYLDFNERFNIPDDITYSYKGILYQNLQDQDNTSESSE